jgi:lysophospholipase L1-like esterase
MNRRWLSKATMAMVVPALVAVIALGCGDDDDSEATAEPPAPSVYLALGDSLVTGVGASDPPTTAYVPLFHDYLQGALAPEGSEQALIELHNLGVNGETTGSMIADGQLSAAVAELTSLNGNDTPDDDVRVVTVSVGGNDVAALFDVCAGGLSPECLTAIPDALGTFTTNFETILGQLRAAAGTDVTIIVAGYYNALEHPDCEFNALASMGDIVLEGEPPLLEEGLNDLIRSIAAPHDVRVAEVFALLDASEIEPDCRHANDDGYEIISAAFITAFEQ